MYCTILIPILLIIPNKIRKIPFLLIIPNKIHKILILFGTINKIAFYVDKFYHSALNAYFCTLNNRDL
ncbi:MAG: hypothetical protein DBY35_07320 [Bacteroidales bacterium]|nr:MAG: hypothetical protein DBY35_07320 [Bacteroidales bacterium]